MSFVVHDFPSHAWQLNTAICNFDKLTCDNCYFKELNYYPLHTAVSLAFTQCNLSDAASSNLLDAIPNMTCLIFMVPDFMMSVDILMETVI